MYFYNVLTLITICTYYHPIKHILIRAKEESLYKLLKGPILKFYNKSESWYQTLYGEMKLRHQGSPESTWPFWISRESEAWPWCNLAASQRRPYCAPINSHSPVGLVKRQWDAVDWACVMCDSRNHIDWASRSASTRQCDCPF